MRVSGFWSAVGLGILGLIAADFLLHPSGTESVFNGVTGLEGNAGNQLIGTSATAKAA